MGEQTNARLHEIAAMMQAAVAAGRKPQRIGGAAFLDEIEITHNFEPLCRYSGMAMGEYTGEYEDLAGANIQKEAMPDSELEMICHVGEGAVITELKWVGTLPSGEPFEWPSVSIWRVADNKIYRVDNFYNVQAQERLEAFLSDATREAMERNYGA